MIKKKRILLLKYKILQKLKLIYLFNLKVFFLSFFLFFFLLSYSQNGYLYYRDQFKGGGSCDGYSPNAGSGGTGNININIAAGSTIKKAFLFAGRHGNAQNVNIVFDGNNLLFDSTNQITNDFFSTFGGNSALHMIEVTQYVLPSQNNYQLIIPQQSASTNDRYTDFYLYVAYENNLLNEVTTNIYLNKIGFNNDIRTYNIQPINKIDNSFDVGIAIFSGYLCDTIEGENVFINNNYLGLIGLPDINNGSCGGTKGSFYYENNTLFGLQDDTANNKMSGRDALSEIKTYTINNDTSMSIRFETKVPNNNTNAIWAIFTTYISNCSFTSIITPTDTICFGDSIQLNATGGIGYSWFGAFGGLSDTSIANPKASPPQTTTYIVTITNDSGCVKTEQVKIWVNPLPVPDTIIVTNNVCGDSTGLVSVGNIANGNSPYSYTLTNLQTTNSNTQITNVFSGLGTGTYEILITDSNGCQWVDTVTVNEVNNVVANFIANPSSGIAPLDVSFTNTSTNANTFEWWVMNVESGDTLAQNTTLNTQHLFDSSGTYQVCLVAYNNLPHCADTICKTIIVEDEISLIVPNVFTPNGDNENDNFVIQLNGAALIKSLKAEVFNRWGQLVNSVEFSVMSDGHTQHSTPHAQYSLWDGYTTAAALVPEGTYFYVISYETLDEEVNIEKGSITLLR